MEIKTDNELAEEEEGESKPEEKKEEKPQSAIERAEALDKSLKEQNDRMESNIAKLEGLKATEMLSGSANAGQAPEEKKEQTAEEYTQAVMAGEVEAKDGKA